ncbi:MAG: TIR domain-containing protein [Lachnospiraceae bacterium]|nr:TIR domain-containing protein [Lachnospiraceae bacterium]
MIYDAFISYRHTPLDMEIAKKVHSGLETYRVPKAVQKKTGKKKIRRVFRDQEELPIGSDLNDNIAAALRESEYLIVICSPETPGSYWVNKEIETFISLHDRHHVLAVLVDGEPDQSFPQMLLTDESGNPVEPLAADVRGATPSERNKKFKTELLRLAAPVLGCTYDDLRQRHRERILKRNLMIAGAAAGILAIAGAAFGIYNAGVARRMKKLADEKAVLAEEKSVLADDKTKLADEKSKLADEMTVLADEKSRLADEILAEYKEKQINQSRFYAQEAMQQLREGNREDAVLIAVEGLPSEERDRPYVADAEYALAAALHAYDVGSKLDFDRILPHDLSVLSMTLDRNADYLTSIDSGKTVYVWDCGKWDLLLKLSPEVQADNFRSSVTNAFADANGAVLAYGKALVRYDYSGKETARREWKETITTCRFYDAFDTALCISSETVYVVKLSDLTVLAEIANDGGDDFASLCKLSRDGRYAAVGHYSASGGPSRITVIDMDTFSAYTVSVKEEYILNLTITDSGNIAAASTNADFYYREMDALTLDVFRADTGEQLYSREIPRNIANLVSFSLLIDSHSYEGGSDIVIAADTFAFSYDEASGELKGRVTLSGTAVTLDLVRNSKTAFIGCRDGNIYAVDTNASSIWNGNTVSTGAYMEDMQILNGGIVLHRPLSNSLVVMKYHTAEDLSEIPALNVSSVGLAVAPSSEYYVLRDSGNFASLSFYDKSGNLLLTIDEPTQIVTGFYDNWFLTAAYRSVRLIDPINGTDKEILYQDAGAAESYTGACLSPDGHYMGLWGSNGLAVLDLAEGKCIYADKDITSVGTLALTADGSKLLISRTGMSLAIMDVATGELTEFADEALRQVSDSYRLKYVACDATEQYIAMACADGYVRILSFASGETLYKIPLQVRSVCFLGFTADAGHILMQGDDYLVHVYDLSDGSCVNSFDVPTRVSYMIEEGERIAVCDNYTVSLIDAESFGRLAYVADAVTYLAPDKTFILVDGREAWSAKYKDYKELLAEAEKQFPGASLSEEKKVTYNIE